ncbi:tripartite tricarboxylate transporter substrate binding protein [Variovorax sp. SRS16]|uniref:tripartite tricarboxylate transporter substrate binding protein n=1 Tax=Variovorax sp. SRS16 TaxID=282217 RepID=UPI0013A5B224|nr:tripartite tricarboxylate transporter substrate binding protein [Variovorax sp. SRS16]
MHRILRFACLWMGLVAALPAAVAAPPSYPDRPIRLLVPFPAGGSTDPVARLVAQKLNEAWGQTVIVDNRPGANTIIGTEALAKSAPDGYTILLTASTHVINALLLPHLPYDSVKDFIPVATLYRSEFLLLVHPSVPAQNLQELIALAKSKPGALNYAISGTGNANQLAGELFNMTAGVKLTSVPYKGGGPAITDLLGGQVQAMFSVPVSVIGQVKAGKLRALAYTGATPLSSLPQVPTFAQAGLPGFDMKSWTGILVPAGTPKPIVDKLSAEIAKILAMPDVKAKLEEQGQDPFIRNPEQFSALMSADRAKFGSIIRAANIKMD